MAPRARTTAAHVHRLTPAFTFSGDQVGGASYTLFRVYVFSDSQCVNVIYPRCHHRRPQLRPAHHRPARSCRRRRQDLLDAAATYLPDGQEGKTYMADTASVQTTESDKAAAAATSGSTKSGRRPRPRTPAPTPDLNLPSLPALDRRTGRSLGQRLAARPLLLDGRPRQRNACQHQVDDLDGRRGTGLLDDHGCIDLRHLQGLDAHHRHWIDIRAGSRRIHLGNHGDAQRALEPQPRSGEKVSQGTQVEYRDAELPQDACANGRVMAFGKQSAPGRRRWVDSVRLGSLAAGSARRLRRSRAPPSSERRSSPGSPHSVRTATRSSGRRSRIPWKSAGSLTTQSTSALLPLKAGSWFYRVRGFNALLPGSAKAMSWSTAQQLTLARPVFRVVRTSH